MNPKLIALVKHFEGFRASPYLCPAGRPTIGYGSTFYENGKRVRLSDPAITEERATSMLIHTLEQFSFQVTLLIKKKLHPNQFAALVSFAYNVGIEKLKMSTLLKRVNADPDNPLIREQFLKWKYANVNGQMVILPGLVKRRLAEANLYFDKS